MKTSCNVHSPGTWDQQWQKDVSWHMVSGEKSKRGDFYRVLSEEQQVGPAKVCLSGSHRRWLQWLSLLRKDTVSHWAYRTPAIIYSPCFILWCSTTWSSEHNPIVTWYPTGPAKDVQSPLALSFWLLRWGEMCQGNSFSFLPQSTASTSWSCTPCRCSRLSVYFTDLL